MATVAPTSAPPPFPAWVPSGHLARSYPCGRDWDAVQTRFIDGMCIVGKLGRASGVVIEDPEADLVIWLVGVGQAAGWDVPGVTVLGAGQTILVPPLEPLDTATLRWALPPIPGEDPLTCPRPLYRAATRVTGGRPDPRVLSTYTSPECLMDQCGRCTKGEVASTPPDTGVVEEPCIHPCHRAEDGR